MIRRALSLLLLLAVGLSLSGCWSRIEANDLAIISMMAIDKTDDGKLQIWLQIVVPAHAGGAAGVPGGGKGQAAPFITVSGTGRTILEAARLIQTRLSRRIFWAHTRVILVGERLAKEGIRPAMDFLLRQRELRLDNYILMVKGDVAEFMGVQLDLEKHPAEALREIMHFRIGTVVTLGDWVRQRAARGADPIMGIARAVDPPKGAPKDQKPQLQLMGTALFHDDRLVGVMDERVTRGLMWLQGEIYMGVVTLELPRAPGPISLEYVAARIRRRVRIEDGKPVFEFRINSEGTISDEQVNLDLGDPKIIVEIEEQMRVEIERRIDLALRFVRKLQVDPAGLGELVRQRHPAVWKRLAHNWRTEEFQRARIVIQVDAKIRRTGLSSQPRGIREEELIKEAK
jgi:spore germination protein KC